MDLDELLGLKALQRINCALGSIRAVEAPDGEGSHGSSFLEQASPDAARCTRPWLRLTRCPSGPTAAPPAAGEMVDRRHHAYSSSRSHPSGVRRPRRGAPHSGQMAASEMPDEEAARLRREVEELRQQLDEKEPEPEPGGRQGGWCPVVAGLLIAIAALLAPISVVATWARDEVEDTDRYVETITPLASNPAVQQAIAARIETEIYKYIDLDQITQDVVSALDQQGLPPRAVTTLQAVSGPLASAIRGFINDRIDALVQSDLFEQAWIEANRQAHTQMVAVLTGEGTDSVSVSGG